VREALAFHGEFEQCDRAAAKGLGAELSDQEIS
jgi:hypothetical protein